MTGARTSDTVSTKLQQIAKQAKGAPDMVFANLAHHIDTEFLREAYRRTRKSGAPGVDGQTAAQYEEELEANLQNLWVRMKAGTYWAPPVRRVHIPKEGKPDETRPLGIPTLEDKIAQRAVAMAIGAVYEQDFYDCSYGFRPERSAHQGLEYLRNGLRALRGGWVLEVDIKGFFDNVDHRHLRGILDLRVRDKGLRRLIDKWLRAGVLEAGNLSYPESGTPQGGVISPILANIYLHEVLDKWFHEVVLPRIHGEAFLVRFADDFIIAFSRYSDAARVMSVLPKRFARFGLSIHEGKTRLVEFNHPSDGNPGSFDFLGFTFHWGESRRGTPVIRWRTAKSRMRRAVVKMSEWCKANRHKPIAAQRKSIAQKLSGHYGYFGLTGNSRALQRFYSQTVRAWKKWLGKRSRAGQMTWEKMLNLLKHYPLPKARVVHSIYV